MKNQNVECLKFFSALGVVIIHYTSNFNGGDFNDMFNSIVRFAVPIFFMLSGFYYKFSTKGFFKNIKIFFIVFAIYTVVFKTSTTFLWFLVPLSFMHLIFSRFSNINTMYLFIISITLYVIWFPILGHASIITYDHFVLYGLNNVIIFAPCFLFGLLIRQTDKKIERFNFVFIFIAILGEFVLFILNYFTISNLSYQGSIWQFIVAGILFASIIGLKNYNHPPILEKLYSLNFDIYLIHILVLHFFFQFVEPIVNSFNFYYIGYTLILVLFLCLVTFWAYCLNRSNFLLKLGI